MKKIFTKEVIIGIISVVSLLIFYSGLNYLKGINVFKPSNHYFVLMPDVVDLQISSPIYVDGFKVGVVNTIQYPFEAPVNKQILVQVSLDKKMKLQTGSYFELKSSLTSGAFLDLELNKYVSTYHAVGDTLTGISNPGLMSKLEKEMLPQVEMILPRLDTILLGIQTIVNHPALTQSLDNINGTTAQLQRTSLELNSILTNDVPTILNDLKQVAANFNSVSENIKDIDLSHTFDMVDNAIVSVDSLMNNINALTAQLNSEDSSLGLLMNDTSLYLHLDSTARNAAELLKDIKENPKKYVNFSVF